MAVTIFTSLLFSMIYALAQIKRENFPTTQYIFCSIAKDNYTSLDVITSPFFQKSSPTSQTLKFGIRKSNSGQVQVNKMDDLLIGV